MCVAAVAASGSVEWDQAALSETIEMRTGADGVCWQGIALLPQKRQGLRGP